MGSDVASFLEKNRATLVAKWAHKVRARLPNESKLTETQLEDSLTLFLDEIVFKLKNNRASQERRSPIARDHGSQRQHLQRGIAELVREYGLVLECVFELAEEQRTSLPPDGMNELTRCLFTGAAEAVEVYSERQEAQQRRLDFESFAFVAHELRNPLSSACMAWELMVRGGELDGRRVQVMERSLRHLRELIDHSITKSSLVSWATGGDVRQERVDLKALIDEVRQDSAVDAEVKRVRISVVNASAPLAVDGDHRLLRSALANLLRNAIKFTHADGRIVVRTSLAGERALIEVEDECGGLPVEKVERLFEAFVQSNRDRTGFGLGLAISKQAVEAHGGTLSVKNLPAKGCIFSIDLPTIS